MTRLPQEVSNTSNTHQKRAEGEISTCQAHMEVTGKDHCKAAAYREKARLIFPTILLFRNEPVFPSTHVFLCVVMVDIDVVIMLQNLLQQPVKLGTFLSRGPMD